MSAKGSTEFYRARSAPVRLAMLLVVGLGAGPSSPLYAAEGPPGITTPKVFAPFDPNAPACSKPEGLAPVLAFAQDNRREFMEGVAHGVSQAARDRGLEYRHVLADNDVARQIGQLRELREAKVGGVVVAPVDPPALSHSLQQLIWAGSYVGTVVPPPAITLLNAPQYLTGKALGDVAAAYIRDQLGGNARVALLTQDSIEFLAPRFVALRDAFKDMPGVTIIADISPSPVDKEGGFATMNIILLAHPDVDVVLGADTVVLGALAALRKAGKARPNQFLGGIDGEPEAVAEIKKGGGPYKASISLASPVFGYAMGQHAADWLEGKSVPQAMDILPRALTLANIAQYEADLANPSAVYADPGRRASYLTMYGNICYDSRDQYVNFPWSSEIALARRRRHRPALLFQPVAERGDRRLAGGRRPHIGAIAARRQHELRERRHQPALGDIRLDQRARSHRHPQPADRRLDREIEMVEHQMPRRLEPGHARRRQPLVPQPRHVRAVQQRVRLQVARLGERKPRQEPRTAHRLARLGQEHARQIAVDGIGPAADRDVGRLPGRIDRIIGGGDLDVDLGMAAAEFSQARQQPAHREGRQRIDAQQLAPPPAAGGIGGAGDALKGRRDLRQVVLADIGQHHAPVVAQEQRLPDPVFEQPDMAADRAMRHVFLERRSFQAAEARRGLERPERIQWRDWPGHR